MKTESEFYKQKHQNEILILEEELKIKHQLKSIIQTKDLIMSILPKPFRHFQENKTLSESIDSSQKHEPSSLIQDGLSLFRSIQEISKLTQKIIKHIKS